MKKNNILIAGIVLIGIVGTVLMMRNNDPAQDEAPRLITVGVEEFARHIERDDVVVLDVRTPQEYAQGHIGNNTRNIDFYAADFRAALNTLLPRNRPYAIYCRSGNRSARTLSIMREMGFTDVVELRGGIEAWKQSQRPLSSE